MNETAFTAAAAARRRLANPAWDLFKQRFYVNCWIDGVTSSPIESALQYYLEPLKNLAEEELWGENDIILINYFVHTFYNLTRCHRNDRSMGYIKEHNEAIHFHTGLFTSLMEPIFACFPLNRNPASKSTSEELQYFLNPNRPDEHFLIGSRMAMRCYPLPIRCRYFDDYTSLIMDGTKNLEVNWTHIVDTNWERVCEALKLEKQYIDSVPIEIAQKKVTSDLMGALELARRRVEANYRTAIPQFYNAELQLLLPLCVRDPTRADLVLTIAQKPYNPPVEGNFMYVGATILTISMAYQNARLIARPERDWLLPPEIINDDFEENNDDNEGQ